MKSLLRATTLLFTLMTLSSFTHADSNSGVSEWVQQTLTKTLSVSYDSKLNNFPAVRHNYTHAAWNGMAQFLSDYVGAVRSQKLVLHPIFDGKPVIVKTGEHSGMRFWRINQNVTIPELRVALAFSLLILSRSADNKSPYIIQSMSVIKKEY